MVRTHKHSSFEVSLQKGELRPDIVDIMLRLSNEGILVDPFGGSGAIAYAAVNMLRYREIHTGDIADSCVEFQTQRLKEYRKCEIHKWNAFDIPFNDNSIDSIVTDPPWGEYREIDKEQLYDRFIMEAERILKKKGKLIFLSSCGEEAVKALKEYEMTFKFYSTKIAGRDVYLFDCTAAE